MDKGWLMMGMLIVIWGLGLTMTIARLRSKKHCTHEVIMVRYKNHKNKILRGCCKFCGTFVDKGKQDEGTS